MIKKAFATGRGQPLALFEYILIGFTICLFILSAVQSAVFVAREGTSKSEAYKVTLGTYADFRRSYTDFESAFVGYVSGATTVRLEQVFETYNYFQNYTNLGPLNEKEIAALPPEKAAAAHNYKKQLAELGASIRQMKEKPSEAVSRLMRKRFVQLNQTMPGIARIYFDVRNEQLGVQIEKDHRYLLFSIICMSGAGLGLVLLLLLKLGNLHRMSEERSGMLDLSNRRLAAIEAAGDGIGLVDPQGRIVYMNRALMNLYDIRPEDASEYLGRPWQNLYPEKGRRVIRNKVLPLLGSVGYWKGDAPIQRRDGGKSWAEMSLTILPDGGLIGTARDIGERRRAESEKNQLQKQVFQAQKMEAVGRLAGGIAHDFNNILASILGYAEFLTDDLRQGSPEHLFAMRIGSGGKQAKHLVEQLLAFSRPEEGGKDIMNLCETVEETSSMLRASQPPSMVIETGRVEDDVHITGNATQIGQILMNLGVNAIDAMDQQGVLRITVDKPRPADSFDMPLEGGNDDRKGTLAYNIETGADGTVRAWLGTLAPALKYVRVRITDTGCGMSQKTVEHIFEPFFTTKPVDRGTGLGLSSVHGLLASHKGALSLSTRVGVGTSFDLFLPAADKEETRADGESPAGRVLGRGRILVVEDNPEVRLMMEQTILRLGYDVSLCGGGLEAIDLLRERTGDFDLVISDYMMPDMTGIEMAEQIEPDFPLLPILILSGYSKGKMKDILETHPSIRGVVPKPVDTAKLSQQIHAILIENKRWKS